MFLYGLRAFSGYARIIRVNSAVVAWFPTGIYRLASFLLPRFSLLILFFVFRFFLTFCLPRLVPRFSLLILFFAFRFFFTFFVFRFLSFPWEHLRIAELLDRGHPEDVCRQVRALLRRNNDFDWKTE